MSQQCCPATEVTVLPLLGSQGNSQKVNQKSNSHTMENILSILAHRYCLGMGFLNQKYKHFHDIC